MRILVVDDEEVLASTMAAILDSQGYESVASFSGTDALQLSRTFRPDLLVTDLLMPGMDGVETARAIRRELPACKVLFISGQPMRLDEITSRFGEDVEFAAKPLQPVEMLNRISHVLGTQADHPKTILNVDDYAVHRYAVTRILVKRGYNVVEAATGEEALDKAALGPDLILLDINLPDTTGFEVCRQLKAQSLTANIPVVMLTNTSRDEQSRAQALESGAADFVTHPVEPDALFALMEKILRAEQHQA